MRYSTSSASNMSSSSTPRRFSSPKSRQQYIFSDRFIPSRISTNLDDVLESVENVDSLRQSGPGSTSITDGGSVVHENQGLMNNLLRSELLGKTSTTYGKHETDNSHFNNATTCL